MTIEEIQDVLAEFENRLLFLENSLPYEKEHREPEQLPPDRWEKPKHLSWAQWNEIHKVEALALYAKQKIQEHIQHPKKKGKFEQYDV